MTAENQPLISIVLPTYKGASKYLRESIDSILCQTYTNWELIIVDDCSPDNTPEVIKSYADSRIRSVRNEPNKRLPASLNVGFRLAKGEYLTWTSDDNLFVPTALEEMLQCLIDNKQDFVYCDMFTFRNNNVDDCRLARLHEPETITRYNCVRACFMYTRRVMEKTGEYDPDTELIEDYDYWVRVWRNFPLYHLKRPLYHYRFHGTSLWGSRQSEIKIVEWLFKLKHGFVNAEELNFFLRDFFVRKEKGWPPLLKLKMKFLRKKPIEDVLKDYQAGTISFTQARQRLHAMFHPPQDKTGNSVNNPVLSGVIYVQIIMTTSTINLARDMNTLCHCEERSDEAISTRSEIASPRRGSQ
ncbi:MAG: glycosyl transferase [Nitrospinae bacterium CG11_big_fil_rev_8_21_14_0_20_56_8]|nr:MAG: glycosyl transferase [Nitrospinae bacterium CG11_big_fil_rev_8_21_14_0_20_56_8]